jgi:glycosyltransferase involved in cell wall biosynthesis
MNARPLISVCIPAYNRPEVLPDLLDSILQQNFNDYEVVICEDHSRSRHEIREIVTRYARKHSRIRYFENETNLGYDANLRRCIEKASGRYVLFMGNDDLMCPGALHTVSAALHRYDRVGVILRSYQAFKGTPANIVRTARYFDSEKFFPAGVATIRTFFRRCVVLPGVVIHRDAASELGTDRFDGTTLYQLYLVANILISMNGVFLPDILVLYRDGGIPEFGHSEKERGKFVPNTHTPESSLTFMRGMLEIARQVEQAGQVQVYSAIVRDIANYSYPILSMHSDKSVTVFARYAYDVMRLGFWRSPFFFIYCVLLVVFGPRRIDRLIQFVKKKLGHTPVIGRVYLGETLR